MLAVIRIRGTMDRTKQVRHTFKLLNLMKPNHATIIPNDKTHRGMLQKVKDAATWGEIDEKTAKALIKKRGRITGNKPVSRSFFKDHGFKSIPDFVKALFAGKTDMRHIEGLKPLFRLNPPRKGFKSVKKSITEKGDLGYRGEAINELLERMM
ncbi:MAG: 50S ribosomal protein L30 [Candidatus Heimdallarchaeota archaeon]|nr:50S ribosomal protein L30 [Candidatus Heimdallarchaeota archaeon]